MRVTEGMMTDQYLYNHDKVAQKETQIQSQLAANTKILNVSDDVSGALDAIRLNSQNNKTLSYIKNADSATSFMQSSLNSLDQVTTQLQNIISSSNSAVNALNSSNYGSIAQSIKDSLAAIVNNVNTKQNGMYLFGGTNYSDDPVSIDVNGKAVVSATDHSGEVKLRLSDNVTETINIPSTKISGTGIFTAVNNIIDSLVGGNAPTQTQLNDLSTAYNALLNVQSENGAKINRFQNIHDLLQNQSDNYQAMLTKVQGIDTAKLVVDLQQQDYLLQVSNKLLANVLPKSLINYL